MLKNIIKMKLQTKKTTPFTSRINDEVLKEAIKITGGKSNLRTKISKYVKSLIK